MMMIDQIESIAQLIYPIPPEPVVRAGGGGAIVESSATS